MYGLPMRCDRVWFNARVATLAPNRPGLGEIENGLIASRDGTIIFAGSKGHAPRDLRAADAVDCEGRYITPGLIDCHTHLVYAGSGSHDFEAQLARVSDEGTAWQGSGIVLTLDATRAATEAQLVASALRRLDALLAEGITTVEIKSGYGVSLENERKQLRAARRLARRRRVTVRTTFRGAHALPPEYAASPDAYRREVCEVMIPTLAKEHLVDAVHVFCGAIGFAAAQTRCMFEAAAAHGLPSKVHAEQLSNQHGAALAARFHVLSADHIEALDDTGAAAMAGAGTVAVLLPGPFYCRREDHPPPIDLLRKNAVPMALATGCNPHTAPLTSLLLAMNMGATLFRMTVEECIVGVTRAAAHALGMQDRIGTIEVGKQCDLAIWNVERSAELVYQIGLNSLHARIWKGGR